MAVITITTTVELNWCRGAAVEGRWDERDCPRRGESPTSRRQHCNCHMLYVEPCCHCGDDRQDPREGRNRLRLVLL